MMLEDPEYVSQYEGTKVLKCSKCDAIMKTDHDLCEECGSYWGEDKE